MSIAEIITNPIFFERNRVFRIYLGGKQFSRLCGDEAKDGMFPEEWIASKVKAINPRYFGLRDGVSVIKDTDIFFDDLLNQYPDMLLGGVKYDCLVKYLDSAIRLPVQVHPTKEFSRKFFKSEYGKTEAWLVVDTRPNAKIYFGFNRSLTKEEFSQFEERSLDERDIMESVLNSVDARVGDVFLIKGGMIHAIGAGCTIIEIQEPTDFTIQPENWCGDYRISENEKYIGLSKSDALDCFDYALQGNAAVESARISPKMIIDSSNYKKESLISYDDTPCFAQNRHTLIDGECTLDSAPSVWIVLDGNATLCGEGYEHAVKKGDYFFMPYAAKGKFAVRGTAVLIECLPSQQS